MESSTEPSKKSAGTGVGFFGKYPRFLETSGTASKPDRLNLRYEAMIQANCDILEGARVLDIASHDGRWSLVVRRPTGGGAACHRNRASAEPRG